MKAVIQRVSSASVNVDSKIIASINRGLLILLGVNNNDDEKDIEFLLNKTISLRIFNDENQNMNLSVQEIKGAILVVSQFTLCANTRKGRRPSFIEAAQPEKAEFMYQSFCKKLKDYNIPVETGIFGAMMEVKLANDGPVTIILDSKNV